MDVKVHMAFSNDVAFGIEMSREEAQELISAWLFGSRNEMEIEGYGIEVDEIVRIELFDLS